MLAKNSGEPADKPGSVLDNHSSGICVAADLEQPTREPARAARGKSLFLYLVLLQVGFTVPRNVATRAVRSYRTLSPLPAPKRLGGLLSVALAVGSRPPGVTWHLALWSPDFPLHKSTAIAWPTPRYKGKASQPISQALIDVYFFPASRVASA